MKWHVLFLVVASLFGFVAADAGKLFSKLSKAYKAHGESDNMEVEMIRSQPEPLTTGDRNEAETVKEPTAEQSLPMEQRYNSFFDNHFRKAASYGPGWYPSYGGMVYDENRMQIGGGYPNMRVNMDQQNVVP